MSETPRQAPHEPSKITDKATEATEATTGASLRQARRRERRHQVLVLVRNRLLVLPVLLVAISLGVFLLAAVSPLNPLVAYLGDRYQFLSATQRESIAKALNLNQSWHGAWLAWTSDLVHGNLGFSRTYNQPVAQVLAERFEATLVLSGVGLALAFVLSILLGMLGLRWNWLGRVFQILMLFIQAIPPFVLALGAMLFLALGTGWFPAGGRSAPDAATSWEWSYLILPASVLALSQMPWMLLTLWERAQENLHSDWWKAGIGRGIPKGTLIRRYVLPLSLAPTITMVGMRLPELIVGAVLVEEVFSWGGLAAALVASAKGLDLPLLTFLTLASAALVIIGNLVADVLYLYFDPRVRYVS
ncbi:ABC transporter, permease protein [Mobiluncus mulieris FB024-16]|nr:ABC transporter, permease protein [Mobiluncus mulieris FB024-16]